MNHTFVAMVISLRPRAGDAGGWIGSIYKERYAVFKKIQTH
jgi:hypothetical protein